MSMHVLWFGLVLYLLSGEGAPSPRRRTARLDLGAFLLQSLAVLPLCSPAERAAAGCIYPAAPLRRKIITPSSGSSDEGEKRTTTSTTTTKALVDVFIVASVADECRGLLVDSAGEKNETMLVIIAWRGVPGDEAFEADVKVDPVPDDVRVRGAPLFGHFFIREATDTAFQVRCGAHVGSVPLTVSKRVRERREARSLLNDATTAKAARVHKNGLSSTAAAGGNDEKAPYSSSSSSSSSRDETASSYVGLMRPHWRFGAERVVLRVLDVGGPDGALSRAALEGGLPTMGVHRLGVTRSAGRLRYAPIAFVDDQAVLSTQAVPMSSNTSHPAPTLRFKFAPVGPKHFGLRATLGVQILDMLRLILPTELDEVRWHLSDARIFRYVVSQAVSIAHISFDYLAFQEEMGYYVGRETFRGLSTSGLVWAFFRSVVIFLYLLDNDVGSVVLSGLFLGLVTDAFKLERVLQPRLVLRAWRGLFYYPWCAVRDLAGMTGGERATHAYDREATRHLNLALSPILVGFALYTLVHDRHRSWYSWLVSSLADFFYLFGFIAMTPQLYINYKFNSVAHLPVKTFAYKIFNTFIDDAFAFIVKMPMKHRIMTLRDDLVFAVFLYQWFTYPTDPFRPNEFGFAAATENDVANTNPGPPEIYGHSDANDTTTTTNTNTTTTTTATPSKSSPAGDTAPGAPHNKDDDDEDDDDEDDDGSPPPPPPPPPPNERR